MSAACAVQASVNHSNIGLFACANVPNLALLSPHLIKRILHLCWFPVKKILTNLDSKNQSNIYYIQPQVNIIPNKIASVHSTNSMSFIGELQELKNQPIWLSLHKNVAIQCSPRAQNLRQHTTAYFTISSLRVVRHLILYWLMYTLTQTICTSIL